MMGRHHERSRIVGISLMLAAFILMQLNVRRVALQTTRQLVQDASAHVVVAPVHVQVDRQSKQDSINDLTTFLPENLLKSNKTICGDHKCFYLNKHNDSIGYLVAPLVTKRKEGTEAPSSFDIQDNAWKYALKLQRDYGVKHFYLGRPSIVTVSPQLYRMLNSNLNVIGRDRPKHKGRYKEGSQVIVQKVASAPQPNVFFGTYKAKYRDFERDVEEFLESIVDKEAFRAQFLKSVKELKKLLKKESCLSTDFQVYLDASGNFHHLDFERCWAYRKRTERPKALRVLKKVKNHIQEILEERV